MTKGLKDIIASEDDMVVSYKLCYRVVVLHRRAKICCVLFFRQDLVGGAWVHHVMIYVTSADRSVKPSGLFSLNELLRTRLMCSQATTTR